jgi:uncharacterized repeat protein (TIGR01451 family)
MRRMLAPQVSAPDADGRGMLPSRPALCVLTSTLGLAFFSSAAVASASTADLSISNPTFDGSREVGTRATYVAHVTNNGPDATDATVSDQLGDAESLVSASASQGSCTQAAPVSCALGVVAPGTDVTITVKVSYVATSDHNQHVMSVAGAADNSDPDSNNDAGGAEYAVTEPEAPVVQKPTAETGGWSRGQAHLDVDAELAPYGSGTYWFEYGTTRAYGHKTAAKSIRGQNGLKRSATIDGLHMNTTYHYRVVLVAHGKTYRGRDHSARTFGKILFPELTLKAVRSSGSSTTYVGKLDPDGVADAPGSCKGSVSIEVYTLAGATLLRSRSTKLGKDCAYRLTLRFGTHDARRYGKKGNVLVQARFDGNHAVAAVGSKSDRL